LTTSDVIRIDPFDIDDYTPTFVPTPKHVLKPIIDTTPKVVPVDPLSTPTQSSPEIAISLPHIRPNHNRKSTQLPYFFYSSYSGSFAAFIP